MVLRRGGEAGSKGSSLMPQHEVREVLQAIADANDGHLSATAVVEVARHPQSPLHNLFEWDNGVAGDSYRLQQARALIRGVKVIITTDKREIKSIAYVRDPEQPHNEQGYISVTRLRSEPEEARSAIIAEFARVAAALYRARSLAEALGLEDEVDSLSAHAGQVRAMIEASPASSALG